MSDENIEITVDDNSTQDENTTNSDRRSNSVMYTIISVMIFFVLYFLVKQVGGFINREYYVDMDMRSFSNEVSAILINDNINEKTARYMHTKSDKKLIITYTTDMDTDDFVSECINFEYGNPVEDLRYENINGDIVYVTSYVDIENPNCYCVVYEQDDITYAEYVTDEITTEIMGIVNIYEKEYFR